MFHSKRLSVLLASALLILNGLSCAPADTVTITLLPSIGFSQKKFHELSREFFRQESSSFFNLLDSSNSCRQMNVRVAYAQGNSNGENIQTFVVNNMRTAMPSPSPFNSTWLNTPGNVEFGSPLQIQVPKGVYTEIGFFAALNLPADASPDDDVCDNIISSINQPTYTTFGHAIAGSPQANITVPLKIFVMETNPAVNPASPVFDGNGNIDDNNPSAGLSGGYYCSDSSSSQTCPVRDLVEIKIFPRYSAGSSCKLRRVRYFAGSNGTPPIDVLVNDASNSPSTTDSIFLNHSDLYEITVFNTTTNIDTVFFTDDLETFNTTYSNLPDGCDATQQIKVGRPGTI